MKLKHRETGFLICYESLRGFLSYTIVHNIRLLGYAGLHICEKQCNCELQEDTVG